MIELVESVERAVFPSISPEAAALGNRLISRETDFSTTIMNEERRFKLSMPATAFDAPGLVLRCKIGGCEALISVSDDQLHELLPKIAAKTSISELPDTLIMAVAETAVRPVLAGLAAYLDLPFSLDRIENNAPADWIVVMVHDGAGGNGAPAAALHFSPAGLDIVMRALAAAPSVNAWSEAENVPVRIEARCWRTAMRAGDIANLNCCDVVLFPQDYSPDRVSLIASDMQVLLGTGRRNGSAITVEELRGNSRG
ncbi:MAG: hypothetical protein AAF936_08700 [Pseudomonadota bacterium]